MFASIVAVLTFVAEHVDDILTALAGLVAVASVIVKLTPTQTDDRWLGKVLRFVEPLSLAKRAPAVVAKRVPVAAVDGVVDQIAAGDPEALRQLLAELEAAPAAAADGRAR